VHQRPRHPAQVKESEGRHLSRSKAHRLQHFDLASREIARRSHAGDGAFCYLEASGFGFVPTQLQPVTSQPLAPF